MNYFNQTEVLNQVLILPQIYIYTDKQTHTQKL